ncbi:MAG: hypothetical protein IJQ10_01565 [Clostridia bacterium]|nr:hypothetical protein [Clostridia bacterium]
MNINYKAENKENKQLNLEKRNRQNSGIPKPVLYTGLSIAGVAAISIIGKILYDKSKKNDDNNPRSQQNNQFENNEWKDLVYDRDIEINGIKLTPADQKWFRTYMILFQQQYPLCWHNASMQFLACPEIMFGEEEYKQEFGEAYPEKIKSMINWMKKQIEVQKKDKNLKIEDYFKEKIWKFVPASVRKVPEGFENLIPQENDTNIGPLKLAPSNFMFRSDSASPRQIYGGKFNNVNFSERMANIDETIHPSDIEFDMYAASKGSLAKVNLATIDYLMEKEGYIKNKDKSFTLGFPTLFNSEQLGRGLDMENIRRIDNLIFRPLNYGFKPTFIAVELEGHYSVFYFLYNDAGALRYVIWANGSNPGFQVLTIDKFCNELQKGTHNFKDGGFVVRYSPQNIVKKYYTPELMFNN